MPTDSSSARPSPFMGSNSNRESLPDKGRNETNGKEITNLFAQIASGHLACALLSTCFHWQAETLPS